MSASCRAGSGGAISASMAASIWAICPASRSLCWTYMARSRRAAASSRPPSGAAAAAAGASEASRASFARM